MTKKDPEDFEREAGQTTPNILSGKINEREDQNSPIMASPGN